MSLHLTIIVGPTATGKTALALELAKKNRANILNADSRQIYQQLEILSGADIQAEWQQLNEHPLQPFQVNNEVLLYGVSCLPPTQTWSAAQFKEYAVQALQETIAQQKNLIIVGGTGLYINAIFQNDEQLEVKPHQELRAQLAEKSVEELQDYLENLSPNAKLLFTPDDWQNPRRLVRAIEIISSQGKMKKAKPFTQQSTLTINETLLPVTWIGLTAPTEILKERIAQRVQQRINDGAIQEVEHLLSLELPPDHQLLTATGVKEIKLFLEEKITQDELLELWCLREFKYAKRQLTWFKHYEQIKWWDVGENNITTAILSSSV